MKFDNLYNSVFAILRIENNQARVVGTGFVINSDPIYILTCNHVVGEGNETNDGNVRYSITKRSDSFRKFDLRKVEIGFLAAKRIIYKPEFDLAILEIDPSVNDDVANKLKIKEVKKLNISFSEVDRKIGSAIEWLSTASSGDLTLTPRFFKGNLITKYITDHVYEYKNNKNIDVQQTIKDANMIEVDQLFIPGVSGSAILNIKSKKVIGFVHGFKSWPIQTKTEVKQDVEIEENGNSKKVNLKYNLPMTTSLSLGIDIKTIQNYLETNDFIKKRNARNIFKEYYKRVKNNIIGQGNSWLYTKSLTK